MVSPSAMPHTHQKLPGQEMKGAQAQRQQPGGIAYQVLSELELGNQPAKP